MLQAINNIDEKYKSQSIISWFCDRTTYILFKQILFVAVFVLFLIIVLPLYNVYSFCEVLQSLENIIVFFLVILLFILARDILSFYRADRLCNKFCQEGEYLYRLSRKKWVSKIPFIKEWLQNKYHAGSSGLVIEAWSEFISYLIISDNGTLAIKAYQFLAVRIQRLREEYSGEVEYNDSINKAVTRLNTDLCKSKNKAFSLFNSNDLLVLYSGQFDGKMNAEIIRKNIWRCLMEQLYYDKIEMIYQHWEYATQRISFFFHNQKCDNKKLEDYIKRYKQFYIMLCGVLLANKKNELLSKLLFYSHLQPPDYPLVPSNLTDILDWNEYFCKDRYYDNFSIESSYPLISSLKSPFTGEQRVFCKDYLALLVLRLEYLRDYLYGHNRFATSPVDVKTPIEIKYKIDCVEELITRVRKWKTSETSNLEEMMREGFLAEEESLPILTAYLESLYAKQKEIKETQENSSIIIHDMQDIIKFTVEKHLNYYKPLLDSKIEFPEHDELNVSSMYSKRMAYNDSSVIDLFPKSYFKEGQEVSIGNFPETIAEMICQEFSHGLAMQFYIYDNESSTIHYDEIVDALDIIKPIVGKHVILFFGVSNSLKMGLNERFQNNDGRYTIDGVETFFLPYTSHYYNRMLIVNKDLMPKLQITPASEERQKLYHLYKISDSYALMWSLENPLENEEVKLSFLKKYTEENLKDLSLLYVYLAYKIYIPEGAILRSLTICDPYSSEVSKLNELKPITQ